MLTLPDELVLVGCFLNGARYSYMVRLSVAAGELAELTINGRISFDWDRVWLVDGTPTMQPTLDALLQKLAQRGKPLRLARCLKEQSDYYDWRVEQLTAIGFLLREKRKVMGIFPASRYVAHAQARDDVLTRLWSVLHGTAPPDPRTVALAGILYGSGIGRMIIPERQDRRLLRDMGKPDPLGRMIHRLLAENSAVAASQMPIITPPPTL